MSLFNETFYTEEFDQGMLDFIKGNHPINTLWNLEDGFLNYAPALDCFWTDNYKARHWSGMTKEEFKCKIEMITEEEKVVDKNTFTKSNLVAGTHVVEIRDGSLMLLVLINGEMVAVDEDGYAEIKDYYREDLKNNDHLNLDIMKVYSVGELGTLEDVLDKNYLTLEWQRPPEKTPSQLKLESLQQKMESLHKEMNMLQKSIEEEG